MVGWARSAPRGSRRQRGTHESGTMRPRHDASFEDTHESRLRRLHDHLCVGDRRARAKRQDHATRLARRRALQRATAPRSSRTRRACASSTTRDSRSPAATTRVLATIHVVLLSHAHGDHIGDQKMKAARGRHVRKPRGRVGGAAVRRPREVVAAKNAAVDHGRAARQLHRHARSRRMRGKPTAACPQTGNDLIAPFAAPCLATVQLGGTRVVKTPRRRQRRRDHGRDGRARQHGAARAAGRGRAQGTRARRA